jgi:epoxyqueuosine reductase
MPSIPFSHLQALAVAHGLSVVGIADGETLHSDMKRLREWQSEGYSGSMTYMQRDPGLLASPQRLFEQVRSVVVVGVHYDRAPRRPLQPGFGRVARYAWGRDYHTAMREHLHTFVRRVESEIGASIAYRAFSDSVPLLERALGRSAGLGFIGKNTMLIVPRAGSFMFLGEVLWDLEVCDVPQVATPEPAVASAGKSHCGTCSRCLDRCPTGAFVSEYTLDARRCISYLTIEKRGVLSIEERGWIGEWIFGCDVCQDVCPFNVLSIKKRAKPDLEELGEQWGVG